MTPLQHKRLSPIEMSETSIRTVRIRRVILLTAKYQLLHSIICLDNVSLLHFFCENNNISSVCVVLLCVFTFLVSCCDVHYDFHIKQCSVRLYLQLFVGGFMSYLRCLCLFTYSGVQHILFVFVLCLV